MPILLVLSVVLRFVILPWSPPKVVYEGLPGEGALAVMVIPGLWQYRMGVRGLGAITPVMEREVHMPSHRSARHGVRETDVGFVWMVRLTAGSVESLDLEQNELRILLTLLPSKGMVRNHLPQDVRTPLRFLKGVIGLTHHRIVVKDFVTVNASLGAMETRTEVIHAGSS